MSNKAIKMMIAAIVVILIFSTIAFLFYSKRKNSDITPDSKNEETDVVPLSSFPIQDNTGGKYVINNPNNVAEVKGVFEKFLKDADNVSNKNNKVQWVDIKDASGKTINLGKFTEATGLFLNQNLWKILDKSNFRLFSCPFGDENSRGVGIIINARLEGNYYENVVKFAREWEPNIIIDTKNIIFPKLNLDPEKIKIQNLKFSDISRGRVVSFNDNEGIARRFYYKIIDESIFMTNYLECFEKVSSGIESEEP